MVNCVRQIQVEGSPRPPSQKSTSTETPSVGPQKPAPKPSQEKGAEARVEASAGKLQSGKGKKKRQGTQAAGEEVVVKAKPQMVEGEEGNGGLLLR